MQDNEQLQYVLVKKTGFLCLTKEGFWFCSHSQQVESEDNFERIGGSSIGGGTFWGLGALLTKTKVFQVTWIAITSYSAITVDRGVYSTVLHTSDYFLCTSKSLK